MSPRYRRAERIVRGRFLPMQGVAQDVPLSRDDWQVVSRECELAPLPEVRPAPMDAPGLLLVAGEAFENTGMNSGCAYGGNRPVVLQ